MNNSPISKYIPLGTIIHRLDPRLKLFFVILYLVDIFIAKTVQQFGIIIFVLLIIILLSKVTLNQLVYSLQSVIILIFFTSLIHLVYNESGYVIFSIYSFSIYSGALKGIVLITCRFILVVSIMIVLMLTTSPTEITHAIEKSFGFLEKLGISVSTFALVLSISLRFIPTIFEETSRIINAQVSRGSNFNEGSFFEKVKKFIPILIPLFIATLKRADELANAMEVRGYSTSKKRSRYKVLRYGVIDYFSYILIIAITIFVVMH